MRIICNRQLLERDLKLRTLSLVKYSHISTWDIEQAAGASHTADHDSIELRKCFIAIFSSISYQLKTILGLYITSLATAAGYWLDTASAIKAKRALFLMSTMTLNI